MRIKGYPVKGEAPAHMTLIGRIITAPSPVMCPAVSFRHFASLRFHTRTEKFRTCFKRVTSFFDFLKIA
jgi:hypothetical protein